MRKYADMKIMQINSVCGKGSTGKIAADIYRVLLQKGHQCKIAYGRDEAIGIPEEDTIRIGSNKDVNFHALAVRFTDKNGCYSKMATKKFIKEVEKYNPDIIHLHNIHGYYINLEILFDYLKRANKPVIWTLHDCWAFTGHCAYFDYIGCDKWKTECMECIQHTEYPKSYADNSYNNYKLKKRLFTSVENLRIVTPSEWLANLVRQSYLNKYKVSVINNGIDLDIFKPTESTFRKKYNLENKKVILGVANIWGERKGLNDLIKLSKMLDDNYKTVIVGKTQENVPDEIIYIPGTTNQKELAEIYTAVDVFVNPTKEDNYPTTNIEAIACGTPVITYAVGGSVESAEKFGKIVKKDDIQALYDAILNMTEFERKEIDMDCNSTFKKYIELYDNMSNL